MERVDVLEKRRHADAARRSPTGNETVERLRCGGKILSIGWSPRGPLRFYDHTKADLKAQVTLAALGHTDCACLKVLAAVRKGDFADKTVGSRWEISRIAYGASRDQRRRLKPTANTDPTSRVLEN